MLDLLITVNYRFPSKLDCIIHLTLGECSLGPQVAVAEIPQFVFG